MLGNSSRAFVQMTSRSISLGKRELTSLSSRYAPAITNNLIDWTSAPTAPYNIINRGLATKNKKDAQKDIKTEELDPTPAYCDPPYLEELRPKVGFYDLINLQIKGHDYVILEKYQSYLHKRMRKMDIDVVKTWSVPYQELQYESLAYRSTNVVTTERILIYERNLQMKQVLVTKLTLLIDIVNMTLPAGVSFNVVRHSPEQEDRIYFKDAVLERYREELQELKDTPLIGV